MAAVVTTLVQEVQALRARLLAGERGQAGRLPAADPAGLIDLITALEELKSASCAAQAEAATAFDAARRSQAAAAGVAAARRSAGVANEIALARRESPHRGQALLGMAKALSAEMPHTLARLRDGSLSEFRAMLLVRESACLEVEHRILLDKELCADPACLIGVGTRELMVLARRLVAELDPAAVVRRARKAEADRTVTVRPAPDTMGYLTGLMPVAQAVSAYASLRKAAEAARAAGDPRSLGQLMADLLLTRLTGVADTGSADSAPAVPVALTITLSDETLAGGHAAADLTAPGVAPEVLPAEIARLLAGRALESGVAAWFRRLYLSPQGALVAMTSRQRTFPNGMAEFLCQRGIGICATPYCDAPVRHADHIVGAEYGGQTSLQNGQGLCAACNYAKQAAGWFQQPLRAPGEPLQVETITPTGHRYNARAPAPPGRISA